MKQIITIIVSICLLSSCIEQQRIRARDRVVVDGDEIPGIGGTKEHPDTCTSYYNQKDHKIHIAYGNNKVLDTAIKH